MAAYRSPSGWERTRHANGYATWRLLSAVGAFYAHVNDETGAAELVRPSGFSTTHATLTDAQEATARQLGN